MTYADGYRAGIEAAAELAKAKDAEAKGYGDAHHVLRALPEQIRALAPAAPEPTDEMKQRLSAWWRSWDTGLSSEAIALFLGMGVRSEHTPSDAADLGRCLRLLDKIPEWRPRLPEMRDAGGAWPFIVDRWPELEALYKAERWDAVYVTLTVAHRTHRAALAAGRVR